MEVESVVDVQFWQRFALIKVAFKTAELITVAETQSY